MEYQHARVQFDVVDKMMHEQQTCIFRARKEVKSLKRKQERLRKWIADVCFVLFVWTAPAGSVALAYAAHVATTKMCDAKVCLEDLEERYLNTSVLALRAIASKEGGMSKTVFAEAKRFQAEQSLLHWIRDQNDLKGVAPNTNMVQRQLARPAVEPVATATESCACDQRAVSISWVQRFRRRWALRRGKFMPGERLTPDVIRAKVILPKQPDGHFPLTAPPPLCFVFDQKRGPPDGPQTGTDYHILNIDGPFLRPHFCTRFAEKQFSITNFTGSLRR